MALAQIYSAIAGDTITAARWNNEFGNIYGNGTDVAFPVTKAVSFGGYTVTLDASGVSTVTSTSSAGFVFTVGSKTGTPSANGSLALVTASTFTDSNTSASGTAALWAGFSIRTPTLAASAANVVTTEAVTLYVEDDPIQGANETLTNAYAILCGGKLKVNDKVVIAHEDSRTATVSQPLVIRSTTSGSPANDIGTGILVQAESGDETPSDIGQLQFAFSDKTAASEDSYFQLLLRTAGSALASAYKFITTTAFQAIFSHANTADRTYTLPNRSIKLDCANSYVGPTSTGAGSNYAHEGTVTISANQALQGTHYYTSFTLDAAKTVTLNSVSGHLTIIATDTITINGTIDGVGAGLSGGTTANLPTNSAGMTQPGGGGGGGSVVGNRGGGVAGVSYGGAGGGVSSNGTAGTQVTTMLCGLHGIVGGGGAGGNGGAGTGAATTGGAGGGSVTLIAPTIILGAASAIKTTGGAGTVGTANNGGGSGGGGAGNYYAACQSYTDNGCTFSMSGGAGAVGNGSGGDGAAGATGLKQINIYPAS